MKLNYGSLKLKVNTDVTEIQVGENVIEVKKYVPVQEKIELIEKALAEARNGKVVNDIKLDMLFHMYMVMAYTNIIFTDKQREDMGRLFDCLSSSGVLDKIIEAIGDDEYEYMYNSMTQLRDDTVDVDLSFGSLMDKMLVAPPDDLDETLKTMQDFDLDKFAQVVNFANAANGGRDIETNQAIAPIDAAKLSE